MTRTADYGLYDFLAARVVQHVAQRPDLIQPLAEVLARAILKETKRQKAEEASQANGVKAK